MSDVYLVVFKSGESVLSSTFVPASLINSDVAMKTISFLQRLPPPAPEEDREKPQ